MENSKLILFDKYKGYSSNLFDNEEWKEFNAFCAGYEANTPNVVTVK